MSFGLGISFGRLCGRECSLEEVYAGAPKIGWPEPKKNPVDTNLKLRAEAIRSLTESFIRWRKI
jgi:hypothetical protein